MFLDCLEFIGDMTLRACDATGEAVVAHASAATTVGLLAAVPSSSALSSIVSYRIDPMRDTAITAVRQHSDVTQRWNALGDIAGLEEGTLGLLVAIESANGTNQGRLDAKYKGWAQFGSAEWDAYAPDGSTPDNELASAVATINYVRHNQRKARQKGFVGEFTARDNYGMHQLGVTGYMQVRNLWANVPTATHTRLKRHLLNNLPKSFRMSERLHKYSDLTRVANAYKRYYDQKFDLLTATMEHTA